MKNTSRLALCIPLAFVAVFSLATSHLKLAPGQSAVLAAQAQAPPDQGPDPADANMAPSGQSYTTEAPPPDGQNPDDSNYAEQPTEEATQPPPPLPDYVQPPPPDDGYIWTPGYWAWGAYGYYWVPGVWVEPPYMGALWTPGYWGFYGSRFLFYPGHWGMHMGWYGGIHYGFGYVGFGYEGGYWNSGHFFYNRVYNNINGRVVHNTYNYNAGNRGYNNYNGGNRGNNNYNAGNRGNNNYNGGNRGNGNFNNDRNNNNPRPSYRGGAGVQYRPQPSEREAAHEPTAPRMNPQVQHEQNYGGDRGQFANQNHGRPATPAISRPIPSSRYRYAAPPNTPARAKRATLWRFSPLANSQSAPVIRHM